MMDWGAWLGIVFSNRIATRLVAYGDGKQESQSARKERIVAWIQERHGVCRAEAFGRLERRLARGNGKIWR